MSVYVFHEHPLWYAVSFTERVKFIKFQQQQLGVISGSPNTHCFCPARAELWVWDGALPAFGCSSPAKPAGWRTLPAPLEYLVAIYLHSDLPQAVKEQYLAPLLSPDVRKQLKAVTLARSLIHRHMR